MKIIWNRVNNEALVKFEVAHLLRFNNIPFALEYRIYWNEIPDWKGQIFDILLYDENENAIGIIECKKSKSWKGMKLAQIERYKVHGLPIFLADGQAKIKDAIKFAKKVYSKVSKKIEQKEPIKMDDNYYAGLLDDSDYE